MRETTAQQALIREMKGARSITVTSITSEATATCPSTPAPSQTSIQFERGAKSGKSKQLHLTNRGQQKGRVILNCIQIQPPFLHRKL